MQQLSVRWRQTNEADTKPEKMGKPNAIGDDNDGYGFDGIVARDGVFIDIIEK